MDFLDPEPKSGVRRSSPLKLQPQPAVFLTIEDLAQRWHKSVHTIRSDVYRCPENLPPICRLPGQKRVLFRLVDVETTEAGHVVILAVPATQQGQRRRGPPTKIEQIRRRRALQMGQG